jgi:predicted solute-binding protein
MPLLRVGIPDLLEVRPLAWSFLKGQLADRYSVAVYPFERIPALLATGDVELGFVSAVELVLNPALSRVRDLGVALLPPARALSLRARLPLAEIRTVDCSEASPWAIDLARAAIGAATPNASWRDRLGISDWSGEADAELLSGPAAHRAADATPVAALWQRRTSSPLPLGGWAVSPRVDPDACEFALKSSLRYGLSSIESIASEAAGETGLGRTVLESHYRLGLSFVLDEAHRQGLERLRRSLENAARRRRPAASAEAPGADAGPARVAAPGSWS